MALHIPGNGPGAHLPLLAGRTAPTSSMSKDSRSYLRRIIDDVSAWPCPGCGAPVQVIKIDQLGMVATDACGAMIPFSTSLPATKPQTLAESQDAAVRAGRLQNLAKYVATKTRRGR